jgi:hypothetical protein
MAYILQNAHQKALEVLSTPPVEQISERSSIEIVDEMLTIKNTRIII